MSDAGRRVNQDGIVGYLVGTPQPEQANGKSLIRRPEDETLPMASDDVLIIDSDIPGAGFSVSASQWAKNAYDIDKLKREVDTPVSQKESTKESSPAAVVAPSPEPARDLLEEFLTEEETQEEVVASPERSSGKSLAPSSDLASKRNTALWRSLAMPFLTEGGPTKPAYRVVFDLKLSGTVSAWYHFVVVSESSIFLVYDVRFRYGVMYIPPNMGDSPVSVTIFNASGGQEKYEGCYSLGIDANIGCLDITVLVRRGEG